MMIMMMIMMMTMMVTTYTSVSGKSSASLSGDKPIVLQSSSFVDLISTKAVTEENKRLIMNLNKKITSRYL